MPEPRRMTRRQSPPRISRRQYLMFKVMADTGCSIWMAVEAVSTTAIEHPEWDMDDEKTWKEWEEALGDKHV